MENVAVSVLVYGTLPGMAWAVACWTTDLFVLNPSVGPKAACWITTASTDWSTLNCWILTLKLRPSAWATQFSRVTSPERSTSVAGSAKAGIPEGLPAAGAGRVDQRQSRARQARAVDLGVMLGDGPAMPG